MTIALGLIGRGGLPVTTFACTIPAEGCPILAFFARVGGDAAHAI
jgi:hypothetical protein